MSDTTTPAIEALLATAERYTAVGAGGFIYSRDELSALLSECSKHIAVGVHDISHPNDDMTSVKITVYVTFAKSEMTAVGA